MTTDLPLRQGIMPLFASDHRLYRVIRNSQVPSPLSEQPALSDFLDTRFPDYLSCDAFSQGR